MTHTPEWRGSLTPERFLDTREIGETVDDLAVGAEMTDAGGTTRVRIAGRGDVPAVDVVAYTPDPTITTVSPR